MAYARIVKLIGECRLRDDTIRTPPYLPVRKRVTTSFYDASNLLSIAASHSRSMPPTHSTLSVRQLPSEVLTGTLTVLSFMASFLHTAIIPPWSSKKQEQPGCNHRASAHPRRPRRRHSVILFIRRNFRDILQDSIQAALGNGDIEMHIRTWGGTKPCNACNGESASINRPIVRC